MKKVQMGKINKNNAMKNNPNLTSHGITLTSLIIYITIMFVVLAIIMRVTTYFTRNINDVADTTFEEEFEKFNMYMLQETGKSGNGVYKISENKITFADENIIEYKTETNEIFYNEIKLCKNIDTCSFEMNTEENQIIVDITIKGIRKQGINYLTFKSKLPSSYQEVEYIESTGTQWITTEISASRLITAEIDTMFTEQTSSSQILLGCSDNAGNWVGQNSQKYATGASHTINIISSNRKVLNVNFNSNSLELEIDGLTSTRIGTHVNTGYYNIFGINNLYLSKARLYGIKIKEINIVINDFIPCYRISDGEIGLYDVINDKFYTKSGTGVFQKGENVNTEKHTQKENIYIISSRIPKTYQEVEYIESTGTQWINTEISASRLITAEIDTMFTEQTDSSQILLGCSDSAANWVGQNSNKYATGSSNTINVSSNTRKTLTVDFNSNSIDLKIDELANTRTGTHDITGYYNVFGMGNNFSSKARLYGIKVRENGIMLGNFIPCYRKSDNEIGLYDIRNDVFYTNSGTGVFIKGPEVY